MNLFYVLAEDGSGLNSIHSRMLLSSIRSANNVGGGYNINVLYTGCDASVIKLLTDIPNVTVHKFISKLTPILKQRFGYYKDFDKNVIKYVKLEVVRYAIEEFGLIDEYFLYCDNDVMFCKDIFKELKNLTPKYLAVGVHSKFPQDYFQCASSTPLDTGIMLINARSMYNEYFVFMKTIETNFTVFEDIDNEKTALLNFYINKIDILPYNLNWKMSWGYGSAPGIIHFCSFRPVPRYVEFVADQSENIESYEQNQWLKSLTMIN